MTTQRMLEEKFSAFAGHYLSTDSMVFIYITASLNLEPALEAQKYLPFDCSVWIQIAIENYGLGPSNGAKQHHMPFENYRTEQSLCSSESKLCVKT